MKRVLKNENSKLYLNKLFFRKLAALCKAMLACEGIKFFALQIVVKKKYLLYLKKVTDKKTEPAGKKAAQVKLVS